MKVQYLLGAWVGESGQKIKVDDLETGKKYISNDCTAEWYGFTQENFDKVKGIMVLTFWVTEDCMFIKGIS